MYGLVNSRSSNEDTLFIGIPFGYHTGIHTGIDQSALSRDGAVLVAKIRVEW